jgi:hypothetical protein
MLVQTENLKLDCGTIKEFIYKICFDTKKVISIDEKYVGIKIFFIIEWPMVVKIYL